jgi:hypothetical protein
MGVAAHYFPIAPPHSQILELTLIHIHVSQSISQSTFIQVST